MINGRSSSHLVRSVHSWWWSLVCSSSVVAADHSRCQSPSIRTQQIIQFHENTLDLNFYTNYPISRKYARPEALINSLFMMALPLTLLLPLMAITFMSTAATDSPLTPLTREISADVHDQKGRPECLLCATTTGIRSSVTERAYQHIPDWEKLYDYVGESVGSQVDKIGGQLDTLVHRVGPLFHLKIHPMLLQSAAMQNTQHKDEVFAFAKQFLDHRGNILLLCGGEHWFWLKEYLIWDKKHEQPVYDEQALKQLRCEHDLSRALRLRDFRSQPVSNEEGHAMVIYDFNEEGQYYAIKNSWGQRSGFEKIGRDMMENIWVDKHWTRSPKPGRTSEFHLAFLAKEEDLKGPFKAKYEQTITNNESADAQDPMADHGIDQSMQELENGWEWTNFVQFPRLMTQQTVNRHFGRIGVELVRRWQLAMAMLPSTSKDSAMEGEG